jgi:conjugative transfer signal peptidase TraF
MGGMAALSSKSSVGYIRIIARGYGDHGFSAMTIVHVMRREFKMLFAMMTGIALVGHSFCCHPTYGLLYNPSESAPRGWYLIVPIDTLHIDDLVIAQLPFGAATLGAQRGYLPFGVPVLKHIAAIGGQRVCARDGELYIDNYVVVRIRTQDRLGRRLIPWRECRALHVDEVLLLGTTSEASFDSRYFGPIHRKQIFGRAIPWWTW